MGAVWRESFWHLASLKSRACPRHGCVRKDFCRLAQMARQRLGGLPDTAVILDDCFAPAKFPGTFRLVARTELMARHHVWPVLSWPIFPPAQKFSADEIPRQIQMTRQRNDHPHGPLSPAQHCGKPVIGQRPGSIVRPARVDAGFTVDWGRATVAAEIVRG